MAPRKFTDADLERWVERGLLSPEQRDAILRDLEAQPPAESDLTLTTLLYYSGGLLVLIAYGIFLGLQWGEMNEAARVAISAASFIFFAAVSTFLLRDDRFALPGELLQIVAIAIVPLLLFAILDAAAIWPEEPDFRGQRFDSVRYDELREQYNTDLIWAQMALAGSMVIVAAGAFRWRPSPYLMAAAAGASIWFFVGVSFQAEGPQRHLEPEGVQAATIAISGAALLAIGAAIRGWSQRNYSLWLYIIAIAALTTGLGMEAFPEDAAGWGALWMIASVGLLALAVPLQERLLAGAGLIGAFAYLAKLVFDVFESANAALVLIVLGLLILGLGMLYQRYGSQLFARPT